MFDITENYTDMQATLDNAPHADGWPEPLAFRSELLPVPTLPLELVPEPMREWVGDISERMQAPPDNTAATVMVMLGALIGTGCGIKPKCKDDWLVTPNLYGGIVGRPSVVMKSPTIAEALKPLARMEMEARELLEIEKRYHEAELMAANTKRDNIKSAMKSKSADTEMLKQQYAALQPSAEPTERRYRTNDATTEKISELLNQNSRGLLVMRDELTALLASWNKEGRESDRAFYLEAWNGTGDMYTDRIMRGTLYTKHMCLSVFGGIQPEKLQHYLNGNGLTNDGMFQRFQFVVYPDEPKNWKLVDRYPNSQAKNRAYEVIKKLATIDFVACGAVQEDGDKIAWMRFTPDAQLVFNEWLTDLETTKIRGDDDAVLVEHFGKYRKLMPAIALILHLTSIADGIAKGEVSKEAAEKAAAWCDYLEAHARRIYGMAASYPMQAAESLARKIARGEVIDCFTARDIYRRGWSRLNSAEIVQEAINLLVEYHWLKAENTTPEFQQKGKTEYRINPKARGFYG